MKVKEFFDKATSTLTYLIYDEQSKDCVVIDPVMDFDPASGVVQMTAYSTVKNYIQDMSLNPIYVLETHVHADHLTGAQLFKKDFPKIKIGISENISKVQKTFKEIFNLGNEFIPDGQQFDHLFKDGEVFHVGTMTIKVIATPGHTPACVSYLIDHFLFTGDTLFMPDSGTGRCDFPQGSAKELYHSIHEKLYPLSEELLIFVGHDYQPNGRELKFSTTLGDSKNNNIHLTQDTTQNDFILKRETRDKTLAAPRLLLPSLQINMTAGQFPPVENNGISYLKLPLKIKI
jgi:glyoxylase-like metal-dependent hydrolase (beta-lactamase superfamily II)